MNPDDLKDLSDELEEIKKKYTAIKEGDFEKDISRLITSTPVTWEDIAGLDNAKRTINETIKYSQMKGIPDALKPWKGILLFGPPGTGKTLFAAATAGTLKATFFNVKPGNLLSKYYGDSSKNISALYNVAQKKAPSIIFLDEFDSIGSKRNDISEASRRVLHTLLDEMDGLHNKKSSRYILTMAATNTPWDLDSAALNRFEKRFYVPLPDTKTVMEIIKLNTQGVELDGDMLGIAQTCVLKLFAGRDVAALCNEAVRNMIQEENGPEVNKPKMRPLTKPDFRKSFAKIKGTITAREVRKYEDWAEKNGSDSYDGGYAGHRCEINEPEIYRKALSEKVSERKEAVYEIGKNFIAFNDRKQSTKILLDRTEDSNSGVRQNAAEAIGSAFYHLTDKGRAINDLHALTKDENEMVRSAAAKAISSAFIHITDSTDKGRATNDLFALTTHKNWKVRSATAEAIGSSFKHLTDLDQATEALLNLANDKDIFVRRSAAEAIGSAFSDLTKKDRATKALLTLANDKDIFVRRNAAEAIGLAFSQVTDKVRAWNDLLVLIKRDDRFVLIGAAYALGSAFPHVTDKDQATRALLDLINDEDTDVRSVAAETFGSVFPYIADKDQATENLLALTKDKKSIVRAYANHSLGRAYIFMATESKDEESFRKELEQALQFFEKSSREETDSQPASFCLPFYRSFYMLTFKKEETKAEVQKYLEEAKSAVEGSHSKEKLLEAVKNLGNALKEVQNLKEKDFNGLKCDLNAYRSYCERAAEMLDEIEGKAPGAARLMRRALPIIDERIKEILSGIEKKTKALCEQTKGTQLINFGEEIYWQGKNLPQIEDPIKLIKKINEMRNTLSMLCGRLIEEDVIEELEILNKINDERYIENKVEMMDSVMQNILIKANLKTRL